MSNFQGQISKLSVELSSPINYVLPIGNQEVSLNQYIGQSINIEFKGDIYCINCDKKIKKTFMQGYCYPCFLQSPQTSECIFKPHLCKAHLGESRDMEWSKKNCLTDTYVYLSLTSHLKVGVTRASHIPSRWIDQGAHYAIKFAKTPNRYLAGMIEVELSQHISDRTQWRKMIQGDYINMNLLDKKNELSNFLSQKMQKYILNDDEITSLQYPGINKPEKIKSINLDKNPELKGKLTGIKGQYLILDNQKVINVRKYTGYTLNINLG
tara:strand:- start:50 stop:850 length:801 start_codon:yes stop_codon:yes gene_type:complete